MDEVNGACALDEYVERVRATARELAEKIGIPLAEAADDISKVLSEIREYIKAIADGLHLFEKQEGSGFLDVEPRAHRRKSERDRSRIAEQTYQTKINQFGRIRSFGRIYKPP